MMVLKGRSYDNLFPGDSQATFSVSPILPLAEAQCEGVKSSFLTYFAQKAIRKQRFLNPKGGIK